jgi:hypothetical protein
MEMKMTLTDYFSPNEAWLLLHRHVSPENDQNCNSANPHLIHEVPPHDIKVGMWCAMNAKQITGPIFYVETILIGM